MQELGPSARQHSSINDEELDSVIQKIKMKCQLLATAWLRGGCDPLGSRLTGLGCILCRTYSVRGPLSLWYVDINHKLIKIVLLIDSNKINISRLSVSNYINLLDTKKKKKNLTRYNIILFGAVEWAFFITSYREYSIP